MIRESLKPTKRQALACFVFGTLLLLRLWAQPLSSNFAFHSYSEAIVLLNWIVVPVAALAVGLFAYIVAAAVRGRGGARCCDRWLAFISLTSLVLVNRSGRFENWLYVHGGMLALLGWGVILLLVCSVPLWPKFHPRWMITFLTLFGPFACILMVTLSWRYFSVVRGNYREPQLAAVQNAFAPRRVLWVILDELDQRLVFDQRPPWLQLPEFDALRSSSLYAANAFPPPGQRTEIAIPELISGRIFDKIETDNPGHLFVRLAGESRTDDWSKIPNVFTDARDLGLQSAIVGFFNPYCRFLGGETVACKSILLGSDISLRKILLIDASLILSRAIRIGPFSFYRSDVANRRLRQASIDSYSELMRSANMAVADPRIAVALIHLPTPHPPGYYNRLQNRFTTETSSYLDNLVLADRTLSQLRSTLRAARLENSTTIIVSGDHGLRGYLYYLRDFWTEEDRQVSTKLDFRVPFLVHFGAEKSDAKVDHPFNTVLTRLLIHAILSGEVQNACQAALWIVQNRTSPGPEAAKQGVVADQSDTSVACHDTNLPIDRHLTAKAAACRHHF